MPPQLPWPGQACSAYRARTSASWSATWKAETRSIRAPGLGVDPGPDRAVGEDDRGRVVLEDGGERPDRGLVARHDGDQPGHAVRRQVHVGDVVDELASDQGEAHLRRAVELAVRDPQGECGRDQPDRQVVLGDAAGQGGLDGLHLLRDAQVALAVAEVADHRPHRVVDLLDVLAEKGGRADPLHVAPRVQGHERGHRLARCSWAPSIRPALCRLRRAFAGRGRASGGSASATASASA